MKNSLAANTASGPCKLKYSPLSKNLIVAGDFLILKVYFKIALKMFITSGNLKYAFKKSLSCTGSKIAFKIIGRN